MPEAWYQRRLKARLDLSMRQLRKPFQHTQTLVIKEVREQIQEDIICYVEAVGGEEENADALCQIVVDNFKKLED